MVLNLLKKKLAIKESRKTDCRQRIQVQILHATFEWSNYILKKKINKQ